ncbi:MAG: alpha/beta hydrolase domain-containing protein [Gemmatimonadota bacterium]
MKLRRLVAVHAVSAATLVAAPASAQIARIELEVVESPALDGESFGAVGQYERLRGVFFGEVDPAHLLHLGIVNLDRAPRNERGRVEYATTVEIYRPRDMSRWNGALYHTVPNRGGAGAGEAVLLEMGFALVRVGWQGDLPATQNNVTARLPIARNVDGSPLEGPAYTEFIFNNDDSISTATLSYPTASLDPAQATLTVRQNQFDRRSTPDDLRWRFEDERRVTIERPAGFDGGAIYEFIYEAKDPIVMGLGFAATRDVISFLRYRTADEAGNVNPLAPGGELPKIALSIGISQSGRYLRDMLYQGFNEDVEGRIVFDGMHPDIAGSRKTFTNFAFSQPGRWQRQHEDHLFPGDQFPFTYGTLTDPISGRTDGILERCTASDTCPKVVHTDGEAELWQGRASLVVTDPLGRDIELPENVRVYLIAGTQHGGGRGVYLETPTSGMCQNPGNPMALSPIRTALTVALYEWVAEDRLPPPSRHPKAEGGGLLRPEITAFPRIPDVLYTASYNPLQLMNYSTIPATGGDAYTVMVAGINGDGNMLGGVRHPNFEVPIGTYTGWNLRRDGFAPGEQCGGTGSYFPFLEAQVDRSGSWDSRRSFQERYSSPEVYVERLEAAAAQLVEERFLLRRHAEEIVRLAREARLPN